MLRGSHWQFFPRHISDSPNTTHRNSRSNKKVVDNGNSVSVYDMTPAALGIGLCVLIVFIAVEISVCLLLFIAAFGTAFFTYAGIINSSMEKLLEEGNYTRKNKEINGIVGTVSLCYLLITTAIFLFAVFS